MASDHRPVTGVVAGQAGLGMSRFSRLLPKVFGLLVKDERGAVHAFIRGGQTEGAVRPVEVIAGEVVTPVLGDDVVQDFASDGFDVAIAINDFPVSVFADHETRFLRICYACTHFNLFCGVLGFSVFLPSGSQLYLVQLPNMKIRHKHRSVNTSCTQAFWSLIDT